MCSSHAFMMYFQARIIKTVLDCVFVKLYVQAHFAQLYFKAMGLKCPLSLVSFVFLLITLID